MNTGFNRGFFDFNYGDPYNIDNNYDFLSDKNLGLIGMSAEELAKEYGFKNPDKYAKFFNEVDTSEYDKIIEKLPELQSQKREMARGEFMQTRDKLQSRVGQTDLAGTGSMDTGFKQLNIGYGSELRGIDKEISGMVSGTRKTLLDQVLNINKTAQNLYAAGAELGSEDETYEYRNPNANPSVWPRFNRAWGNDLHGFTVDPDDYGG